MNDSDRSYALKILDLRLRVLRMRSFDFEYHNSALQLMDYELSSMMKGIIKYDFVERLKLGNSLLVGEGNLSFSVSLIQKIQRVSNIIASTYEQYRDLSDAARTNTALLKKYGVTVLHGVDAITLHQWDPRCSFDTIIFQFPHAGTRESVRGFNPNYVLVRDFIKSASAVMRKKAVILVTLVDTDFYNNMFQLCDIAKDLNIRPPVKYKFSPNDYPGYIHTMTHQDESALDAYSRFATWEFTL